MNDTEAHAAARAVLAELPSIDVHAHPGRFFMRNSPPFPMADAYPEPAVEEAVAELRAGSVTAAFFSAVADHLVLERSVDGLRPRRPFAPGEAFADYRRQRDVFHGLVRDEGLTAVLATADITSAHASRTLAAAFAVEGGDFIEDQLERIDAAYADGVRCVTIVHYTTNQIGDAQTNAPLHGGLTRLGREIVCELQRAHILVDLTHASEAVTRDAVGIATHPMIISHAILRTAQAQHARTITPEHARLVTDRGGVIGAVPFGFGQATFRDYIDSVIRLVDALGIDHVAIGTDMHYTFAPVFCSHADWVEIPASLFMRGLQRDEVAKIMGGNVLRLLGTVSGLESAA